MTHPAAHPPTVRLGAVLLLQKGDKILLGKRRSSFADGRYMFMGGHVEHKEPVKKCLAREIKEEIGISIAEKDMTPVHILHVLADYEAVWVVLKATKWKGSPRNLEPEKCSDLGWFPINRLPRESGPHVKEIMRELAKGRFFSEQRH